MYVPLDDLVYVYDTALAGRAFWVMGGRKEGDDLHDLMIESEYLVGRWLKIALCHDIECTMVKCLMYERYW